MSLVPANPTAVSVVSMLEKAKVWLATAVDMTGPEEIAAAKAQIRTAETYAKELGLSKEIQDDAREMVRRAEYALGKSIRKGQAEGTIHAHGGDRHSTSSMPNLKKQGDFGTRSELHGNQRTPGILTVADETPDPEHFAAALTEARSEGNLSRANVARIAREKADPTKPRATSRRGLPDSFFDAAYDLTKAAERVARLTADDRFPQNAETVAAKHRSDLLRAIELLSKALDRFPS